ncbi:MAG: hypothetical protein WC250_00970 [Candidatus Paceibacterota bacterium]|jgi:diadenosine tetraphosphate (Ap4A) HIT family hydrolase
MSLDLSLLDDPTIGSLGDCRTLEYYQELRQKILKGECPFCELDTARNPVLLAVGNWRLWKNPFPYKHSKHHLVIAHQSHQADVDNLAPEDWSAFGSLCRWAIHRFQIPGGGIAMRFGDANYNASTIRHLHAHIQVPDRTGNVRATFAKDPTQIATCRERAVIFEKLTQGFPIEQLAASECLLIEGRLPAEMAERLEQRIKALP